ncbi:DUF6786 family protein [Negadavirga shengliensis]|uniref:DUF6786 family protein n=1 Tax=Negadavirga shengliensis TaxID=1389218 RepID=A0ABV9T1I9_9BACT
MMTRISWLIMPMVVFLMSACHKDKGGSTDLDGYNHGTFGYDLKFLLEKDDSLILLESTVGNAKVAVSPKYQGKVFTSSADGLDGKSFGWINYEAFDQPLDPHMNAYGGENRLWLGPEGGQYSVFFGPGDKMEFENWVTPPAVDYESWEAVSQTPQHVSMQKEGVFPNYLGTEFNIRINRDVRILEIHEIQEMLDIELEDDPIQVVAYETDNTITNIGGNAWTKASGAPCIWILDMFTPSPHTTIVIPYHETGETKVATTDYFGEIPQDRIAYHNGVLFFKADGKHRGKLGMGPERAKPVAGSFDAADNVLTLTVFDVDPDAVYLNQEWTTANDPLQGDAVNAYNDGPLEDGSQMGPFYELESVSPAAFLKPGEKLRHRHSVFHFVGDKEVLNRISLRNLGVSLEEIRTVF